MTLRSFPAAAALWLPLFLPVAALPLLASPPADQQPAVAAPAAPVAASPAGLTQVHTIYFLPMTSGLDQYIASEIVKQGTFQVVTDPKRADAIVTDRVGEAFEKRLADLLAPPPPPKSKDDDGKPKEQDWALQKPEKLYGGAKGRGMVFLVDPRTKAVLWSIYNPPKNYQSKNMHRAGAQIAHHLQADLKKSAQPATMAP